MTTIVLPEIPDLEAGTAPAPSPLQRVTAWLAARWIEFAVAVPILAIVGTVQGVGINRWPLILNDDEGTYMSQAWAVLTGLGPHHGLAQYTYWYDHPPVGWIQLAYIGALAHAFEPGQMVVEAGRHIMVGYALASTALVYLLARRLGCSRGWAAIAMAMFGLSPLSVDYLRLVFLDCIGLPWVLAAFVVLHSPRKRVWTFAASGVCFAICVLSKETYLLMLPALVLDAWVTSERPTRRMSMVLLSAAFLTVAAFYPLYAALKGELVPGKGHVSLLGSALWQVDERAGSGSVFSPSSASHDQVMGWLHSDPWLVGLGIVAVPLALLNRKAWGVIGALAIFAAALLRHGYLPEAFVVGALPFAALAIGVAGNEVTRSLGLLARRIRTTARPSLVRAGLVVGATLCVAVFGGLAWHIAPEWVSADDHRMFPPANDTQAISAAEQWMRTNVPHTATLLVDDDVWTDFVEIGFEQNRVVWTYKLDLDPAVHAIFPQGWRDIDYVVSTPAFRDDLFGDPSATVDPDQAVAHSSVVASFGTGYDQVKILKVNPRSQAPGKERHVAAAPKPAAAPQ